MSKSSLEMERYILNGEMPVFGYPLICYSPNNSTLENEQQNI